MRLWHVSSIWLQCLALAGSSSIGLASAAPPSGTLTSGAAHQLTVSAASGGGGSYAIILNFGQPQRDVGPYPIGTSGLIVVSGTLYGTRSAGGDSDCNGGSNGLGNGCGSVFEVNRTGTFYDEFDFSNVGGGEYPSGGYRGSSSGLLDVNGALVGTAGGGKGCGANANGGGCGTIFSVTITGYYRGTDRILYDFRGKPDGQAPNAPLINVGGTLYGTTNDGGAYNEGTVFAFTATGQERVLHSFGGSQDGAYPQSGLIDVNGTLYGNTTFGGAHGDGSVFSITPSGVERVLHSFSGLDPGPSGTLLFRGGILYGTTGGTVYSLSLTGVYSVLHRFTGPDGSGANGVIDYNGSLVGTTYNGGAYAAESGGGGTVFELCPSGFKVLHSFGAALPAFPYYDGSEPTAPLVESYGVLYGTTSNGGEGWGTVFALQP